MTAIPSCGAAKRRRSYLGSVRGCFKNAKHPSNAMKFIDYVAGPHFQAKLAVANVYYSMVPNRDAVDKLSMEHRKLLNLEDPAKFQREYLSRLAPRKFPPNVEAWKAIWAEFKAA